MNIEKAREILGDRARWELLAMRRALTAMPFFNTDEDDERLEAVHTMLHYQLNSDNA